MIKNEIYLIYLFICLSVYIVYAFKFCFSLTQNYELCI